MRKRRCLPWRHHWWSWNYYCYPGAVNHRKYRDCRHCPKRQDRRDWCGEAGCQPDAGVAA